MGCQGWRDRMTLTMRLWFLKSLIGSDHRLGSFSFTTAFQNTMANKKIPMKKTPSHHLKTFVQTPHFWCSDLSFPFLQLLYFLPLKTWSAPSKEFFFIQLHIETHKYKHCATPLHTIKIPSKSYLPSPSRSAMAVINKESKIRKLQNMALSCFFSYESLQLWLEQKVSPQTKISLGNSDHPALISFQILKFAFKAFHPNGDVEFSCENLKTKRFCESLWNHKLYRDSTGESRLQILLDHFIFS